MRLLVTGATGLIGTRFAELAAGEGHEVLALVRSIPAHALANVNYIRCDLAKDHELPLLPEFDAVVHLAQSEKFRNFPADADEVFRVNTLSTASLLSLALKRGARSFVLASTGGVYGGGNRAMIEDDPVMLSGEPGFYVATKMASEMIARAYSAQLSVQILRVFFAYGPGQRPSMLMPRLIASVQDRKPVRIIGDAGIRINPIFVDDAARSFLSALDLEISSTINVAGSKVVTIRELCELIGTVVGTAPVFTTDGTAADDLVADTSRMTQLLHSPLVPLISGIRSVIFDAN